MSVFDLLCCFGHQQSAKSCMSWELSVSGVGMLNLIHDLSSEFYFCTLKSHRYIDATPFALSSLRNVALESEITICMSARTGDFIFCYLHSLRCSPNHCICSDLCHPRWHSYCQLQCDVIPPVQCVNVIGWHPNNDKCLWSIWLCNRVIQLFHHSLNHGHAPQWCGQLHLLSKHHPRPACSDRGVQRSCLCSCLWWVLLTCTLEHGRVCTVCSRHAHTTGTHTHTVM